jgi:hypothetical protein
MFLEYAKVVYSIRVEIKLAEFILNPTGWAVQVVDIPLEPANIQRFMGTRCR